MALFKDRIDAGRALAERLVGIAGGADCVVLALSSEAVALADEVARALDAQTGIYPVRRLEAPRDKHLVLGALAPGGVQVINFPLLDELHITQPALDTLISIERDQLEHSLDDARRESRQPDPAGKTAVLVDLGAQYGAVMQAAVQSLQEGERHPARLVAAVPVAVTGALDPLREQGTEIICLHTTETSSTPEDWYEEFRPSTRDAARESHPAAGTTGEIDTPDELT